MVFCLALLCRCGLEVFRGKGWIGIIFYILNTLYLVRISLCVMRVYYQLMHSKPYVLKNGLRNRSF